MAYTAFLNYLSYTIGDVVTYNGGTYVFTDVHTPGEWDASQVVQINNITTYGVSDFNTLPDYNVSSPLGAPKYKVVYNINNDDLVEFDGFPLDNEVYAPGATVAVEGYDFTRFSEDGVWAYEFSGWSLAKGLHEDIAYNPGDVYTFTNHDLILYASWSKVATISVDSAGRMTLNAAYKDAIDTLYIPEYFGGSRIKIIGGQAFFESSINTVVIPPNIIQVEADAFEDWTGSTLRFVDSNVTTKYPALQLDSYCFDNTPGLSEIILPYRWRAATGKLFPVTPKTSTFKIKIRNTEAYMSDLLDTDEVGFDVESYIADADNLGLNYSRIITWGYND
jgi:hypothetical protein